MKKCIGVILALITLLVVIVFIITVKDTKATTMRLEKTQGTVDVTNQKGIALPVRNDIKLYSGYGIATENTSYAYINLDDTKAVKLDESSSLTVKKKGKKLNLLVESGKLFFNVKVPLKDDESMEIQTSNMITGIRGTSGFVDGDRFGLLTGAVDVTYIDPETGEKFTESLKAGEIFIVTHTKAEDGTTTVRILVRKMTPDDIPGFVAEAIAQDSELQDKITKESDLNVDEIAAIAAKKRQGEQGENGINILKDVKSPEKKEQILKNIESGNELPVFGGSDSGTPSRSNLDVTSYPPNNRNEIFYGIMFHTDGGSVVTAQEVAAGSKATKPTDPTKADYTFGGWYTTKECTTPFDFNTGITGATTLYAKWTPLPKYQVTFDT
ncbi:MAG: InlB B-repeat-containing protein, partial [Lachnospiraceae bacterium]